MTWLPCHGCPRTCSGQPCLGAVAGRESGPPRVLRGAVCPTLQPLPPAGQHAAPVRPHALPCSAPRSTSRAPPDLWPPAERARARGGGGDHPAAAAQVCRPGHAGARWPQRSAQPPPLPVDVSVPPGGGPPAPAAQHVYPPQPQHQPPRVPQTRCGGCCRAARDAHAPGLCPASTSSSRPFAAPSAPGTCSVLLAGAGLVPLSPSPQ